MGWEQTASGYAAVWATENTREAIFDAMDRRETYATTGPRMIVRFFGGWDFEDKDAHTRMPARAGYTKGVPMGGDLTNAPNGKVPTFLVAHHWCSRTDRGVEGSGFPPGTSGFIIAAASSRSRRHAGRHTMQSTSGCNCLPRYR
jgi:hypothetical protein